MKTVNENGRIHRINAICNEIDSLYHSAALRLGLSDSAMFVLYTAYEGGGKCHLSDIYGAGICLLSKT